MPRTRAYISVGAFVTEAEGADLVSSSIVDFAYITNMEADFWKLLFEFHKDCEIFFEGISDVGHCVGQREVCSTARLL